MGELKVTPANARHPKCREYSTWITRATWSYADLKLDLRRLEAWDCPIAGRRAVNTPIMSILCNAMQFKVQRRMPDPGGVRFRRVNPSTRPAANRGAAALWFGQNPSPFWGEGLERPQLFGLAASIAARLTI